MAGAACRRAPRRRRAPARGGAGPRPRGQPRRPRLLQICEFFFSITCIRSWARTWVLGQNHPAARHFLLHLFKKSATWWDCARRARCPKGDFLNFRPVRGVFPAAHRRSDCPPRRNHPAIFPAPTSPGPTGNNLALGLTPAHLRPGEKSPAGRPAGRRRIGEGFTPPPPASTCPPGKRLYAVLAYAVQIYFDFSGYTDMAIASPALFNINPPQEFQFALPIPPTSSNSGGAGT